jgi:hypothetical protein
MVQKGYNSYRSEIEAFKFASRNRSLEFHSSEPASGLLPPSAMTCRWIFCSIAVIHFPQRSEAVIGLRVINF